MGKPIPYEENHKKIDERLYKKCSICNEWKEMIRNNFYANKSNKIDGFNPYCIICTKKKSDQWAHDNWDRRTELRRRSDMSPNAKIKRRESTKRRRKRGYFENYLKENPDKQLQYNRTRNAKNHNITIKEWDYCRLYFDYRCAYCGKTYEQNLLETKKDLHKEHVDNNGSDDLSNCVPSCRDCNSEKWEFKLDEWYNSDNPVYDISRHEKIMNWITGDYKHNKQ